MAWKLEHLPKSPGVYVMKNDKGVILYIGKAKRLKDRVAQYFHTKGDKRETIPFLMAQVADIETFVTQDEREAILLEQSLIKQHKPKYNILLKDDKSYLVLTIDTHHPYPAVRLVRAKDQKGFHMGPFTRASAARELLDLIKKLFRLRSCSDYELIRRKRPCILYGMGRCLAPCAKLCSKESYAKEIERVIEFLEGKDDKITFFIKEEIEKASDALDFEKAGELHKTLEQVQAIFASRNSSFSKNHAALDVYSLFLGSIVKLIFRKGIITSVEKYPFIESFATPQESLESFLLAHYELPSTPKPEQILLPFSLENAKILSSLIHIPINYPQKGYKKDLVLAAQKQASHLSLQKTKSSFEEVLTEMQEEFDLESFPGEIEILDISHLAHQDRVGVIVRYSMGEKNRLFYRKHKIESSTPLGDPDALKQIALSHYAQLQKEERLPDCILIDGAYLQLEKVEEALEELGIISIDLLSIAKESARHDKGLSLEKIYRPGKKNPIILPYNSSLLFFLQAMRDEAHRFAITYQKLRRKKRLLQSVLDTIAGIGPKKRALLLATFGSVERIRKLPLETLEKVKGLSKKEASNVFYGLNKPLE